MPMENENALERIGSLYYDLTASEKKLADCVLSNPSGSQFFSISQLAEACSVAEATVSRFCRRLGYKGFNEFRVSVANAAVAHKPWDNPLSGEITQEDTLEIVSRKLYSAEIEAISQTVEVLDLAAVQKAADLLHQARRVICMGQGGTMIMAMEASHLFSTVSRKFMAISDSHQQVMAAATADEQDVIFFFSYSGSAKVMMDILKLASAQKAKIILVTRFPNAPGVFYADVVLQCGSNQTPIQTGSVAARIAQLYLLDVLFSEFSRRDMEQCRTFRTRIANALADQHL